MATVLPSSPACCKPVLPKLRLYQANQEIRILVPSVCEPGTFINHHLIPTVEPVKDFPELTTELPLEKGQRIKLPPEYADVLDNGVLTALR